MTAGRQGVEGGTQALEGMQTRQRLIAAAAFHFFTHSITCRDSLLRSALVLPLHILVGGGIPVGMASPDHESILQEKTE